MTFLLGTLAFIFTLSAWGAGMNTWMHSSPADRAWEVLAAHLVLVCVTLLGVVWMMHFLTPHTLYRPRTLLIGAALIAALVFVLSSEYRASRVGERAVQSKVQVGMHLSAVFR